MIRRIIKVPFRGREVEMSDHVVSLGGVRCDAVHPETGDRCNRPTGHPGFHVAGDHLDPEATVWGPSQPLPDIGESED